MGLSKTFGIKLGFIFYKRVGSIIDLSCASLNGSPTPAKNGGQVLGYQGRKTCKTTNRPFIDLYNNQGVMLAASSPQAVKKCIP
jgi:hypothetical protein